ncbi:MAG: hypothetical protein AAF329_25615 [Cyanobacteria bacterium P01_A01_bin.17]
MLPDSDVTFLHGWIEAVLTLHDPAANADLLSMLGILNTVEKQQLWRWFGANDKALQSRLMEAA